MTTHPGSAHPGGRPGAGHRGAGHPEAGRPGGSDTRPRADGRPTGHPGGHPGGGHPGGHPGASDTPAPPISFPTSSRRQVVLTLLADLASTLLTAGFLVRCARLLWSAAIGTPAPSWWPLLAWGVPAALLAGVGSLLASRGVARDAAELRPRLADRLVHDGPLARRGAETSTGSFVNLATDSVDKVANYRQNFLGPTIASVAGPLLVLVVVALVVDPWIALCLAILTPVVPLAIRGFQKLFAKDSGRSRMMRARLAGQFLESVQGLETLVLHRAARRRGELLAETGERNRQATMTVLRRNLIVLFVTEIVFSLVLVSAAVLLARWRLQHGLSGDRALVLVLLTVLLVAPAGRVGSFFYIGMVGRAAARQVGSFLGEDEASTTGRPTGGSTSGSNAAVAAVGEPVIAVHDLVAGHGRRPVLRGIDLTLPTGGRVVLQGPSGGGKSTLLSVLAGDLLPSSGHARVAGIELTEQTQREVRAASAVVQQGTWLFTGSVADNLRIARPEARDADLWQVLDRVGLAGVVRRMPLGLDTQLGEQGHALSGGQRQRLSLARALLSGRRLLLLDEPTSQVDLDSEQVMMAALDELSDDHAMVLVTHREGARVRGARTLVLDAGILHEPDAAAPHLEQQPGALPDQAGGRR